MKAKHSRRRLLKAGSVLLVLVLLYLGVCAALGPLRYRAFYESAEPLGAYRGLNEGFVPQGITQDEASGACFVCGYMDRAKPSRLYVYMPDGSVKRILLQNTDGTAYEGHAGGMTVVGDRVYISNAHKLFLLNKADVLAANDGDILAFRAAVPVPCNASFCSGDGQYVYVGEYHAKGYETDETHAMEFGGESFAAMVFAYPVLSDGSLADGAAPTRVFVVPDAVQGFAADGNNVYLSRSAGFSPSAIEAYTVDGATDGSYSHAGKSLPLYVLGKARLAGVVPAPRMSEDLEIRNGRLLVGFESGARKFGCGLLPVSMKRFVAFAPDAVTKKASAAT